MIVMWTRLQALWANPWVRWPVNGGSVLLMVPLLVWLSASVFSKDEPLRPQIQALLTLERPVDDPDNAYFSLVGLGAPDGADAHRAGSLAVWMAFDRLDRGQALQELKPELPGGDTLQVAPIASVCAPGQAVCLPQMRARVALARAWEQAHEGVWSRYLDATRLPRYADVPLGTEALAQRLEQLSEAARFIAVERWVRRQPGEALQILDHSIGLCRLVLSGTVTLHTKLTARRCVTHGWQLASALVLDASGSVLKRHAAAFRHLAPLLLPDEVGFVAIAHSQLRTRLPTLLELPQARALARPDNPWVKALLRPFFLQRATLNRHYEDVMAQTALERAPYAELARYQGAFAPTSQHASGVAALRVLWARVRTGNPIGQWLLDFVPRDELVPHLIEVRALESQRRLYLLVLSCKAAGLLPKDPAACAATAPTELRNPFDGSAPVWNAQQRTLSLPISTMFATTSAMPSPMPSSPSFVPLVYVEMRQP